MVHPKQLIARGIFDWLFFALAIALLSFAEDTGTLEVKSKRTNFLIFIVDDLAWEKVGYNGGRANTSYIDSLVRSEYGRKFTNFHSNPSCSPSRAALMAGVYAERSCLAGTTRTMYKARKDMTTIAHDANSAGYRTMYLGKWHMGDIWNNEMRHFGFDQGLAFPNASVNYDGSCFCPEAKCRQININKCAQEPGCFRPSKSRYCGAYATASCPTGHISRTDFMRKFDGDSFTCNMLEGTRNGELETVFLPPKTAACDFLAERTARFIQSVPSQTPFLAVLAFPEVHVPYVADPERRQSVERRLRLARNSRPANFFASVECVDDAVRSVHSAVIQSGRASNTLVLFFSDNGGEVYKQGGFPESSGFRGLKRSLFEGGHRVPMFVYWPDKDYLPAGGAKPVSALTHLVDVRPTLLSILRQENPGVNFQVNLPRPLDGKSFLPLISTNDTASDFVQNRTLLICLPTNPGEGEVTICASYAYYIGQYKMITSRRTAKGRMLFNLHNDKGERRNFARSRFGRKMIAKLIAESTPVVRSVLQEYANNCPSA